jgi:hypothetical protein
MVQGELTREDRQKIMYLTQLQGISRIREKEKENKLKSLRLGIKMINREFEYLRYLCRNEQQNSYVLCALP